MKKILGSKARIRRNLEVTHLKLPHVNALDVGAPDVTTPQQDSQNPEVGADSLPAEPSTIGSDRVNDILGGNVRRNVEVTHLKLPHVKAPELDSHPEVGTDSVSTELVNNLPGEQDKHPDVRAPQTTQPASFLAVVGALMKKNDIDLPEKPPQLPNPLLKQSGFSKMKEKMAQARQVFEIFVVVFQVLGVG